MYIGSGVLIAGGVFLLIFGDKESKTKYWKGMNGYLPEIKLKDDLLIRPWRNGIGHFARDKSTFQEGVFEISYI